MAKDTFEPVKPHVNVSPISNFKLKQSLEKNGISAIGALQVARGDNVSSRNDRMILANLLNEVFCKPQTTIIGGFKSVNS